MTTPHTTLREEIVALWGDLAELRDELLALSQRIDNVHTQALRALTDALQPREKKQ